MRNFPVKIEDKEYWISRSCAVVGIVYKTDGNGDVISLLANKRGIGCPDYIGKWNLPCGYLDYYETLRQAVSREVHEETGLDIPYYVWKLWYVNSDPNDEKQTVSFRFITKFEEDYGSFNTDFSEPNEVEEVKWIPVDEIYNYEWAFNQQEVIGDFLFTMNNLKIMGKMGVEPNLNTVIY